MEQIEICEKLCREFDEVANRNHHKMMKSVLVGTEFVANGREVMLQAMLKRLEEFNAKLVKELDNAKRLESTFGNITCDEEMMVFIGEVRAISKAIYEAESRVCQG